jgi:hypothetical protein
MQQGSFYFYNISFRRKGNGKWVFAQGEITNGSNKDFNTAVFRLITFDKNVLMWTGNIKIMGFRKRHTRPFELLMEGLDYRTIPAISRYDIYFESGY